MRYLFSVLAFTLLRIKAGCFALPPLLTLKQMMQQRQCSSVWSAKDELPVGRKESFANQTYAFGIVSAVVPCVIICFH